MMPKFKTLSPKQLEILKFAYEPEPYLICCGAVRAGKSHWMTVSFVEWLMANFNNQAFALCGKTVTSAERNLIIPLMNNATMSKRYAISYNRYDNRMVIRRGEVENTVWCFGGRDESSGSLIQGVTLAGVLLDEVVLMPESFVNQAIARTLSIDESKVFFSCNPGSPTHWFYTEWIEKIKEKNCKYIHFKMTDNPGVSKKGLEKAEAAYSGIFKTRFLDGEWVKSEGLIFSCFDPERHIIEPKDLPLHHKFEKFFVSMDYGTSHARVYLKAGLYDGITYILGEDYYDGSKKGTPTVGESYNDLVRFIGEDEITCLVYDKAPISVSFNEHVIRQRKYTIVPANNEVLPGISTVHQALSVGRLKISSVCAHLIREFSLYSWNEAVSDDVPIKENDDCLDALRYLCHTKRWELFGARRDSLISMLRRTDD